MKKLFACLLAVTVALSAAGCQKKEEPMDVFKKAAEKNAELDSIDMTSSMNMTMAMGENSLDFGTDMDVKMSGASSDDLKYYAETSTNIMGTSLNMTMFYTEGYYYLDMEGDKMKYAMDIETMMEEAEKAGIDTVEADWISEISMEESGDDKILTFTADPAKMDSYVQELLGASGAFDELADSGMTIESVSGVYTVGKDGYYKDMKLDMTFKMTVEGTEVEMTVSMDAVINNPGQPVTVEIPSTEGYQEIDISELGLAA